MDEHLRRLERQVATGDYAVRQDWVRALIRAGYPDPDLVDLVAPMTEAECAQEDYDDTFWHADRRYRLQLWGGSENGLGWYCDNDFHTSLHKAHHTWGHRGWNNKNRKQKTLRTHRNSKHKSRKFRLRDPQDSDDEIETDHARRRKKRFGGRAHREWRYGPFRLVIYEVHLWE